MTDLQRTSIVWGHNLQTFLANEKNIKTSLEERRRSAKVLLMALRLQRATDITALLRMDEEIALILKVPSVRLARYLEYFVVEIPLPKHLHKTYSLETVRQRITTTGLEVPLGMSAMSQPVTLRLNDPGTPHSLVVGTTGCGKTTLMQAIILQAMMQNAPADLGFVLIDIKNKPFGPFIGSTHLRHPVVTNVRDALAVLEYLAAEVRGDRPRDVARTVVAIDELAYLVNETGGSKGDAASLIGTIASVGREHGTTLLAGTQHASQDVIGGPMASANFPARLVGSVTNASQSAVASGRPGVGAEKLLGAGDFLLVTNQGEPVRFQAPEVAAMDFGSQRDGEIIKQLAIQLQDDAQNNARADPIDPRLVADLLWRKLAGEAAGVTALAQAWGVGSTKVRRVRSFSDELEQAIIEKGVVMGVK